MNVIRNILAGVAVSVVASGCATGRIADLRDCGRISIGYGLGLGAEASLGVLGSPSVGIMSHKAMFGYESRDCVGMWVESETFWPASSAIGYLMGGLSDGSSRGPGYSYFAPYGRHIDHGVHLRRDNWQEYKRERNFLIATGKHDIPPTPIFRTVSDIEASLTLGIVSARAGINPLEIVDFTLGFVGIDIANDDPIKKAEANRAGVYRCPACGGDTGDSPLTFNNR